MASQSRKYRGYETQGWLAEWFKARGWPYAEAVGAGRPGVDVTGMPGIAVEAKARAKFEPKAWLRQATGERRHGIPVAIFRCNGQGKAAMAEWGALLTLADFTQLIREAGYGSPEDVVLHDSDDESDSADNQHADGEDAEDQVSPSADRIVVQTTSHGRKRTTA